MSKTIRGVIAKRGNEMSDEPKCFECSGTGCELIGETYAFCDDACRSSFMASLLA